MTKVTYSRHHPGRFGLACDFETSGADFGGDSSISYQGIAFGAVIFDTETFEPVETLYRELQFDGSKYIWTAEAEKIHGLSKEHLAAHGVTREEGLVDLLDLIQRYIGTESKIMFLGHNVIFDVDFVVQLARDHGIKLKIHHVMLDTSSTAFMLINKYRSDEVFEFFTGKIHGGTHNALDDALTALETARNMRAVVAAALEST